jgi:hypothetical protein
VWKHGRNLVDDVFNWAAATERTHFDDGHRVRLAKCRLHPSEISEDGLIINGPSGVDDAGNAQTSSSDIDQVSRALSKSSCRLGAYQCFLIAGWQRALDVPPTLDAAPCLKFTNQQQWRSSCSRCQSTSRYRADVPFVRYRANTRGVVSAEFPGVDSHRSSATAP